MVWAAGPVNPARRGSIPLTSTTTPNITTDAGKRVPGRYTRGCTAERSRAAVSGGAARPVGLSFQRRRRQAPLLCRRVAGQGARRGRRLPSGRQRVHGPPGVPGVHRQGAARAVSARHGGCERKYLRCNDLLNPNAYTELLPLVRDGVRFNDGAGEGSDQEAAA